MPLDKFNFDFKMEVADIRSKASMARAFVQNAEISQRAKEEKMDELMEAIEAYKKRMYKLNRLFWHLANNVN